MDTKRLPKILAFAAMALALVGALVGSFPSLGVMPGQLALSLSIALVAASAWFAGSAPRDETEPARSFQQELALHGFSLLLLVVFLLLGLTELLAIPAALGQLEVFGQFALGFIKFYPALLGSLACALAVAALMGSTRGKGAPAGRARNVGIGALAVTGVLVAADLLSAGGLIPAVRPERSVFVLAAALMTSFLFARAWLRLPAYGEVSDFLEREDRLQGSNILRQVAYAALAFAGLGIVIALVASAGLAPAQVGLLGSAFAMLALLGATFNVGVSHIIPKLEMGMENALEVRKTRRVILSAASIGLSVLSLAVGALTFFALLYQVAGLQLFKFLLDFYVEYYPLVFAIALVPLVGTVILRMRVQTEVRYSDKLKALAMGLSTLAIVLTFFGVFIGAGFANGTGITIDNAVLVMGAAVLCLIQFVKARTLLPGILSLFRESVAKSEAADADTKEIIKNRMVATYVMALVFVMGFLAFFVATSLGVVRSPTESLGRDVGFFVYLLAGVALLVIVVMRYFQNVNIDQRWAQKDKAEDIGKKRLTSAEVKRYLILGFSIGVASILTLIGILVYAGVIHQLGPFAVAKKYSTDFWVFAILIGIGPYGWYQSREASRIEAIDAKFPELLRDLAESQRSGMTLTEAVITASKGSYGVLTPEIRKMAAQIEWGVAFTEALQRLSKRVDTPLIRRTVALIVQASSAGGNVVDVLTAAADDARELHQIVKERKQSMSIYLMIIYIAFAVFIGVIAVLNAQFIPEVAKAVSKADGVSIGGLHFKKFDQDDFKTLFFHAALIQGLGGGIVGGVMAGGKPVHGIRHSFILVVIAWVLFRLIIG